MARAGRWGLVLLAVALMLAGCRDKRGEPTPTPPPVEKVACEQLMDWIRMRPLSKACEVDADCVIQSDGCCDQTAMNKRYARECPRTCEDRCPQDSRSKRTRADASEPWGPEA